MNQNLNLPNESIVVIHETENSSSLGLVSGYLSLTKNISWPSSSVETEGPDEIAAMVRKTPYSIGYLDFSYAIQTKMTFAAVRNSDGLYIIPSSDSIKQGINAGVEYNNATADYPYQASLVLTTPQINASKLGNSSYPILGL